MKKLFLHFLFIPFKYLFVPSVFLMLVLSSYRCTETKASPSAVLNDSTFRFGFWNLENLFDTKDDAYNDGDFTPKGANKWTETRYQSKLGNLAKVISEINADALGVCEVENERVLKDLLQTNALKSQGYAIVHYDSPDERGIDVAFLYKKSKIEIIQSKSIQVELPENDKTRDILYIQFKLVKTGDTIHYFVNHWPSRREGAKESAGKRAIAAQTLKTFLDAKGMIGLSTIICGDFNDNTWDSSLRNVLGTCRPAKNTECDLFNLTSLLDLKKGGTLKHAGRWDIFDQLIVSNNLWKYNNTPKVHFKNYSIQIFSPEWMKQHGGKFDGTPLRTFGGKEYLNGYSDHFPVFAELSYE